LADYPYFEQPPAFAACTAIVGRLNLLKAAWTMDAAMLSYERTAHASEVLTRSGFKEIEFLGDWSIGAKGAQGYFAARPEFAILAFRGTEPDDWRDIVTDLTTWPANEDGARVHRGFQAQLDTLWSEASKLVKAYRGQSNGEIFFTGHSLGAGLATIAASRFERGGASLYAYGSPRVGDEKLGFRVEHRNDCGVFRIVDRNDLVARVPPAVLGYEHLVATLYQILPDGSIKDRTTDWGHAGTADELFRDLECLAEIRFPIDLDGEPPADVYDHAPGCYCNGLWNRLPTP
jgi:hypothetical protein